MRLQISHPASLLASRAADNLMQQLKCALSRTGVAIRQTQVCIDDTNQVELRKMVSFGGELRADDDIEATGGDLVEALRATGRQTRRDRSRARESGSREKAQTPPAPAAPPRGPRGPGNQLPGSEDNERAAAWRIRSDGRQTSPETMIDEPGVAVRATQTSRNGGKVSAARIRGG